jgi:hypothetical protein
MTSSMPLLPHRQYFCSSLARSWHLHVQGGFLSALCRCNPTNGTDRGLPYVQQLSAGREVPIKNSCDLCCCLRDSLCIQSMPVMGCMQRGELGNKWSHEGIACIWLELTAAPAGSCPSSPAALRLRHCQTPCSVALRNVRAWHNVLPCWRYAVQITPQST